MDPMILAQNLVAFLAPFLPYLLKAGEKAAEETGKKLGSDAWEKAKGLWAKLRPKVNARPAAQEATQDLAQAPTDEDAQAALRLQMKKLLLADEKMATELAKLWQEVETAGISAIASGERSVAIGGDVSGSTIMTGDVHSSQVVKAEDSGAIRDMTQE